MQTVSTKLDNSDFTKFQNMCNDDGMCASEELRDMIRRELEAHEEYLESLKDEKPKEIAKGTVVEFIPERDVAEVKEVRIVDV